jgi:hypothetical protein
MRSMCGGVQKALLVALAVAEAGQTGHLVHELLPHGHGHGHGVFIYPARLYVPAGPGTQRTWSCWWHGCRTLQDTGCMQDP